MPNSPATPSIRTPAQVRALRSPTRQEVMDALDSSGPCSAAELASLLNRAPDALYHHLRTLLRVGLIVERDARKSGRHVAAIYDLPIRPMRLSYAKPVKRDDIAGVVNSALRLSLRDFERGLREGAVAEGPLRAVWGGRVKGWVDDRALTRINALIQELHEVMRAGRPGDGHTAMTLGFVLAPARRARVKRKPSSKE